jgi:hypothetical protein
MTSLSPSADAGPAARTARWRVYLGRDASAGPLSEAEKMFLFCSHKRGTLTRGRRTSSPPPIRLTLQMQSLSRSDTMGESVFTTRMSTWPPSPLSVLCATSSAPASSL